MFWKFDLNTTSHVDKLLDKEDVTLEELMDEDDVLQECKAQNRRLLDFLCQQRCMEQLVTLITHEPPVDMDEKWLNEARIIQRLVELIHSSQDEDRQSNASQTLCDIIRLSRDQSTQLQDVPEPDPLLTALESVEGLMDSYTQGFERSYTVNSSILHGIEPRLKDFHQLLLCPPKKPAILTTLGVLEEPLGNARLHGSRLIAALLHANTPSINHELCRLGTLDLLLLFQKCCLVQRILDAWEANDKIQAEGGRRRGNMGHLTRIANAVVHNMEKGPMQAQISDFIKELPEDCRGRWESFVEETLTETNRRNTVDLVSTHHLHSSSEDEDIENAFPNELTLQQAFSEYQIQQMTANFVDQFGFNDEEFADQDDNIKERVACGFPLVLQPNASLFEACCNERIQQFDDNEEEEDIWEEKDISYATQVKSRTRDREEELRDPGVAHSQFPFRFGASQTSESSKSDLENGDHDGSVDSEEEEERPPPPSPHKGSTPEQKDSDSCQGVFTTLCK
ncbi:hypothetical protein EK904_006849 [Melospiza melodia maxima]|nr:hypothetical protein EK904_006849 [Melospiza melodia maxima]